MLGVVCEFMDLENFFCVLLSLFVYDGFFGSFFYCVCSIFKGVLKVWYVM